MAKCAIARIKVIKFIVLLIIFSLCYHIHTGTSRCNSNKCLSANIEFRTFLQFKILYAYFIIYNIFIY